jgi:hypothetical protein
MRNKGPRAGKGARGNEMEGRGPREMGGKKKGSDDERVGSAYGCGFADSWACRFPPLIESGTGRDGGSPAHTPFSASGEGGRMVTSHKARLREGSQGEREKEGEGEGERAQMGKKLDTV